MLVERRPIRRRVEGPRLPIHPHGIHRILAVLPQQTVAVAGHAEDVRASVMAMSLLVRAHAKLRDVSVHGAVCESELDVPTAGAALLPLGQGKAGQVRDKVGLPLVAARLDRSELTLATVIARLRSSVPKSKRVVIDEVDV